jgi:hypothetical protein
MCTVTIIPRGGGVRVAVNRDESPRRALVQPPSVVEVGGGASAGVRASWPVDVRSGGTWIGASDGGLVLAVLNGNPRPMPPLPPADRLVSRGLIIPGLIAARGACEACERLAGSDLAVHAPFRLIAADRGEIHDAVWDGRVLRRSRAAVGAVCYASSGLGDEVVRPRLDLWRRWVVERGATAEAQDAFHRHAWPDRPEISVMMVRDGARTLSVTVVEAPARGAVRMIHEAQGVRHEVEVRRSDRPGLLLSGGAMRC